jgi:hypothetical protein
MNEGNRARREAADDTRKLGAVRVCAEAVLRDTASHSHRYSFQVQYTFATLRELEQPASGGFLVLVARDQYARLGPLGQPACIPRTGTTC